MKKLCFLLFFVSFFGLLVFGDTGEQEEIDFLLFLPNSGNRFVNEEQAMIQLDKVANYLMTRNPGTGKVSVHGYAAAAANDVEPFNLSKNRALYVINELQKRGLKEDLFAEPVACGSVDLWGGNTNEKNRRDNRRVRILLDNTIVTPAALRAAPKAVEIRAETPRVNPREKIEHGTSIKNTGSQFPWWIIPLLLMGIFLIAIIVFLVAMCRRNSSGKAARGTIPVAIPVAAVPSSQKIYILSEEEIRRHAYKLYQLRDKNGDAVRDWYRSMRELTAFYEAQGYRVILYWEEQALAG